MRFTILTIFPKLFDSFKSESIIKRAIDNKLIEINILDIRDFSKDKHKKVDDTPYGGGAGMLMTCQPLFDAIREAKKKNKGKLIYLSPKGEKFTQNKARKISKEKTCILLCGRYEGIDQRVIDTFVDEEISIGNYVLTGGELPAMVLIDSISRLIPKVLGKKESHEFDSFSKNLKGKKEYPHYTKPAEFEGLKVPDILLSGDHKKIEKWRMNNLK